MSEALQKRIQALEERVQALEENRKGLFGRRVQVMVNDPYYRSHGNVVNVTHSQEGRTFVVVRMSDGTLRDYAADNVWLMD